METDNSPAVAPDAPSAANPTTDSDGQDPLVSVVLPTRDRGAMIEECVRSCLDQTYRNLELVVVDESRDETPEILERLAAEDPRMRVYYEPCATLPGALNYGFRWTRGELLTWMCDDDIYEPDAIEVMVRCLQKMPDVGMVYCDFKNIDADGRIVNEERRGDVSEMDEKSVIGRCILYRRSVYAKVGDYSVEDRLNEDDEYYLRIRDHFKIHHIDASPLLYRTHDDALSIAYRADVTVAQYKTWAKRAGTGRERRRILRRGYLNASHNALYRRGRRAALPYIWSGFKACPITPAWPTMLVKVALPRRLFELLWERRRAGAAAASSA